ncbi:MAG: hypothetical protein JWM95_732 [Gemmatimonadetes bacterium]|nr:hypothetical protein [Gemmatimonadota bacterium]
MQQNQGNMVSSLRAIEEFLDGNAAKLGSVVQTSLKKNLHDALVDLDGHATDQSSSTTQAQFSTAKHRDARTALTRDLMAPIARIAKVQLPGVVGIEKLRMPKARTSAEQLAAAARGMAEAASPYTATFIAAGVPADFAAQLNSVVDTMLGHRTERAQSIGKVTGATKSLKGRLAEARRVVHAIDALMKTALKDDSTLLASWNQVKRVHRTRGTTATTAGPATPSAPAIAAAA